jgi:hypothetical protein
MATCRYFRGMSSQASTLPENRVHWCSGSAKAHSILIRQETWRHRRATFACDGNHCRGEETATSSFAANFTHEFRASHLRWIRQVPPIPLTTLLQARHTQDHKKVNPNIVATCDYSVWTIASDLQIWASGSQNCFQWLLGRSTSYLLRHSRDMFQI